MDLAQLRASTPPSGWLTDIPALIACKGRFLLTGRESKELQNHFQASLVNGDLDAATNAACIGLLLDETTFLSAIRRKGLLRPSAHDFHVGRLRTLVKSLVNSSLAGHLPAPVAAYLKTLLRLYSVSEDVLTIVTRLVKAVQTGKEKLLKGLLATVDLFFMSAAWQGTEYGDTSLPSRNVDFYSVEKYAEAFSYIVFLHQKHVGQWTLNPAVDAEAVTSDRYMNLLVDASHVRHFHEFETLIDIFGYTLEKTNLDSEYRLLPWSDAFEKAVRLGYIQTRMQELANAERHPPDGLAMLRTAGQKLYDVLKDTYVQFKKLPVERFIFNFPEVPQLWDVVTHRQLFAEENAHLASASKALLTPIPELLRFEIVATITLEDLLRAQRIFSFVRWYAAHHLMPLVLRQPDSAGVVLQSLVPHFTIDQMRYLLGKVVSGDKIDSIIDLWTWNQTRERVFDVQYQPFLDSGEGRLIPLNILSESNMLRNVLALKRRRLYEDGSVDPVSEQLALTLKTRTPHVVSGRSFAFEGVEGEIDVAALLDDTLFVFECKNSLLPTGPHELRTSWDYVEKAAFQLSSFCRLFEKPDFRSYISTRFGLPSLSNVKRVATCIVMANRMFMGYRFEGHPIRGTFELTHFIEEGTIWIREESMCYWAGNTFSSDDLVRYLQEDIAHKNQFDSMIGFDEVFQFGRYTIRNMSYKLDLRLLAERLGFRKTIQEIDDAKESQVKGAVFSSNLPGAQSIGSGRRLQRQKGEEHTGRNDPCPCGSGKKFKRCHWRES